MPLYAALCFSLLLTRARRRGPVWCAAVLLWLVAGQELPRGPGAGVLPGAGAGIAEAAEPQPAGARECWAEPWYGSARVDRDAETVIGPRVRSLLCRELPPVRAPDLVC